MLREWNDAVPDDGIILHLGDLCYRNNGMFKHVISKKLKGEKKYIVKGNHDHQRPSFYRDSGFTMVKPFAIAYDYDPNRKAELSKRYMISFSHYPSKQVDDVCGYPGLPNDGRTREHIHLHGHIHNNGYGGYDTPFTPFSKNQINVSVEQTHYRPVNLKRLLDGYLNGCYEPPRKRAPTVVGA